MYFKYGTHQHDDDDVSVSKNRRPVRGEDGTLQEVIDTLTIRGTLQTDTVAAMTTAMRTLADAYRKDDQNCGLYLPSGTITALAMPLADYEYVRVVDGITFQDEPGSYTGLYQSYSATIEGKLKAKAVGANANVLEYEHSIEIQGTGGPDIRFQPVVLGYWPEQQVYAHTPQTIVQSGSALGHTDYVPFPAPVFPDRERGILRRVWRGKPEQRLPVARRFPSRWTYIMELNAPQTVPPPSYPT